MTQINPETIPTLQRNKRSLRISLKVEVRFLRQVRCEIFLNFSYETYPFLIHFRNNCT